jgi:hypothetical protein
MSQELAPARHLNARRTVKKTMQAKAQLDEQIKAVELPAGSADSDPQETAEWLEAWDQILDDDAPQRASYMLNTLMARAKATGLEIDPQFNTPYINTIRVEDEEAYPGDR